MSAPLQNTPLIWCYGSINFLRVVRSRTRQPDLHSARPWRRKDSKTAQFFSEGPFPSLITLHGRREQIPHFKAAFTHSGGGKFSRIVCENISHLSKVTNYKNQFTQLRTFDSRKCERSPRRGSNPCRVGRTPISWGEGRGGERRGGEEG